MVLGCGPGLFFSSDQTKTSSGGGVAGWLEDDSVLNRAKRYVSRCALPNGAYTYDLTPLPRISGGEHINNVLAGAPNYFNIPEPGSLILLAFGVFAMGVRRRRS